MSEKKISRRERIIGGLAIVVAGLVVMLKPDIWQSKPADTRYPLVLEGLEQDITAIDSISIAQAEQTATLIRNSNGEWVIKEKHGYPASAEEIRKALIYLSQSELRDPKTANPELYERLGLDDTTARHLTLTKNGETAYELYLGGTNNTTGGTYIRLPENPQSYLASGKLEFRADPLHWLDTTMFSVERDRIASVAYQFADGKDYRYERSDPDASFDLSPNPPEGKAFRDKESEHKPHIYFERIPILDVLPASRMTQSTPNVTTVTTFDGLVLRFTFHEADFKEWTHITADANPDLRDESNETLKPMLEVGEEAQAINERTQDWLYELGQYQYNQLRRPYDELLVDNKE